MAILVRMPEVLAGATEAVVSSWQVEEGAEVVAGDVLAEIETEKAIVDYAAESDGVVARLLAEPGRSVPVGDPIAVLLAPGEPDSAVDDVLAGAGVGAPAGRPAASPDAPRAAEPAATGGPPAVSAPEVARTDVAAPEEVRTAVGESVEVPPAPAGTPAAPTSDGGGAPARLFSSPLARRLAKEHGIALDDLTGTGPRGRIVRRDIEAHLEQRRRPATARPAASAARAAAPAGAGHTDVPHTPMRRAIARRLTESKATVPHFYLTAECRVDALLDVRRQINAARTEKVSVNDFVIKAVAAALLEVPEANAVWTPEATRRFDGVDLAVAVATDGGLVTPVLRGVEAMSLGRISAAVAEVAGRARAGRLRQEELEGGSFAVSNLGMYGTREFAAIINPPQAGILAVGAASPQPVVDDGELAVATVMRCTLSADHRVLDGVVAAQWLAAFQRGIENPLALLV